MASCEAHRVKRVERRDMHSGAPVVTAFGRPVGHDSAGTAFHNIEQPGGAADPGPQVDQPGDEAGGAGRCRRPERGFVQSEDSDVGVQPLGVKDPPAILADRAHHGAPADAEVRGHLGDWVRVLPDPAAGLHPRPFHKHRPPPDRRTRLRPGPLLAARLRAPPHPLPPHQHDRPAAGRQARTQRGLPSCHVATTPQRGQPVTDSGLDQQLPLTAVLGGRKHHEPGQPERRRCRIHLACGSGQRSTVSPHLGSPDSAVSVNYGS